MRNVDSSFWINKKVFVTGHTGFKGAWLCLWLQQMGAVVKGFSLDPPTNPSLFQVAKVGEFMETSIGDIRDYTKLELSMKSFDPEIVIHMAAQPIVRYSYGFPLETFEVNVMGTANVLEASRNCQNLRAVVSVTTDKCYENREWVWGYREDDHLGGHDPYSSSKACAELVSASFRKSFFGAKNVGLATARAGNVIGGGDWASDRLIPDILKAFDSKQDIVIRNPRSTRPWQHVLEPLSGYLILAEDLYIHGNKFSEAWNFGPNDNNNKNVAWIVNRMLDLLGREFVGWDTDTNNILHEANFLKLDYSKAKSRLNWEPKWDIEVVLARIVSWHNHYKFGDNIRDITLKEIKEYSN